MKTGDIHDQMAAAENVDRNEDQLADEDGGDESNEVHSDGTCHIANYIGGNEREESP